MQRVERRALRLGDGRRYGEPRADAAQPGGPQQPGPGLDDLPEDLRRIGGDRTAHGRGGDDPAAEPDQRGPEAVRVDLRGERDGPLVVDGQPVRGPALGTGSGAGT